MRSLVVSLVVLCACHGVRTVTGPDGHTAFSLSCDYETDCLDDAGRACPSGYVVLSKNKQVDMSSWTVESWTMLIQCRPHTAALKAAPKGWRPWFVPTYTPIDAVVPADIRVRWRLKSGHTRWLPLERVIEAGEADLA